MWSSRHCPRSEIITGISIGRHPPPHCRHENGLRVRKFHSQLSGFGLISPRVETKQRRSRAFKKRANWFRRLQHSSLGRQSTIQKFAYGLGEFLRLKRLGEKVDAFFQWKILASDFGAVTADI